jgi:ketopantoate reductase
MSQKQKQQLMNVPAHSLVLVIKCKTDEMRDQINADADYKKTMGELISITAKHDAEFSVKKSQ